jgi:hypothetical protein
MPQTGYHVHSNSAVRVFARTFCNSQWRQRLQHISEGFKWEPAGSTHYPASSGFSQPSRINSLSGFNEPSRIHSLSGLKLEPAGSTHSLASSGFNQPSRINSLSGFIGLH